TTDRNRASTCSCSGGSAVRARRPRATLPGAAPRSARPARCAPPSPPPVAARSRRLRDEDALRPRRNERIRLVGCPQRPDQLAVGIEVRLEVFALEPQHSTAANPALDA